jgi:predicted ATPase/transcriptional regulator with XRE-family HTH domain
MGSVQTVAFGDLVRRYRVAADLTQEELAERAGLSARAISDIERGVKHAPRRDTVALLAEALELSPQQRLAFEGAARRLAAAATQGVAVDPHTRSAGVPPLVGRARELGLLDGHIAGNGPPVLLLAGEHGIGKSRLLHEAAMRANAAGWAVLRGGCYRRGGQEPYAPVVEALQSHLRRLSPAQLRAALQQCTWLVRLLPELMDTAGVATPTLALPPEQERRLMFGAVGRFLTNVAGPAGTVLVLDDLQWAGPDALDLLATLVRSPSEKPLRIVGGYRDVEVRLQDPLAVFLVDLVRDGLAAQIRLGPLSTGEAAELLDGLVGQAERHEGETEDANLAERVLRRAGGVPFFLVSCAQALATGALAAGTADDVPWDVAQSIRQRVAALPEAAQELLGVAAVAGRRVARNVLVTVAARPARDEDELLGALDAVCQTGMLTEAGDDAYQFAHDLVREVVRNDLRTARRAALHRRIAEVLERGPGHSPPEVLAYHFGRGGQLERAVVYLERAGERAQAMHANATAAGYYRELVQREDELGRPAEAARAREKLGAILRIMARYDQALNELERAAEAYRAEGDHEGLGRASAQLGRVHARRGTPHEGVARLLPLVKTLEEARSGHGLASVQVALAELYFAAGRHREQLAAAERAAELARGAAAEGLRAEAEQWRSIALLALGRPDEALPALEEVMPRAEAAGDLSSHAHALNYVALAYIRRGEFGESLAYVERALAAAKQRGDPAQTAFMTYHRGVIALHMGHWDEARRYYERAATTMRQIGLSWSSAYPLVGLGQLSLYEGKWQEASQHLDEASAMAERGGDLEALRYAQLPLIERDLLEGQTSQARARLDRLLDRRSAGWDEGVAHILLLLAWTHVELDDAAQAEELVALSIRRAIAEENRLALVDALRVQALRALRQRRWQDAEGALHEALALARAMSYPYGEARVLCTYGLVHVEKGEPEQARERLAASLVILNRLGERLYAETAEKILASSPQRA